MGAILKKAGISRQESELLKYESKIKGLETKNDARAVYNEKTFIKRKIDDIKNEIRQLENNLSFFNEASEDNPLVKEVHVKIRAQKEALGTWKAKMKQLNIMQHNLQKSEEEAASSEEE